MQWRVPPLKRKTVWFIIRAMSDKHTTSTFGLALWIAAALILFILFIVNQGKIIANLKSTGFFNRVFGKTPAFVENAPDPVISEIEKNDVAPVTPSDSSSGVSIVTSESEKEFENTIVSGTSLSTAANTQNLESAIPETGQMNLKLFFMSINSDGSVTRREVTRQMRRTQSPLVAAINALIVGPTVEEEGEGCRTLVSNGTRLLGASVSDGVAQLNFSGEFEFNQYGIEGTRGQLQQIVYTATAFPTVESVQFLVDGEKRDYLGGEGVWIGTPLSRSNFLN